MFIFILNFIFFFGFNFWLGDIILKREVIFYYLFFIKGYFLLNIVLVIKDFIEENENENKCFR